MSSTTDLLHRLRRFVRAEAELQYTALERQWSHPLSERVSRGWAIEGLSLVERDKGLYSFKCDTNQSRFREGDLLVLHRGMIKDPNSLHVELQYDGETELVFSIIRGNPYFLLAQTDGWIADQDWFDGSSFYLSALDSVADSLRGRSTILPLLQNSLTPKMDYAKYERIAEQLAETTLLNNSQIEAVASAYAADLLYLIQGPPGTGKTWVLAHLCNLLVNDGLRVLVTALTHRAIHNALNKIPLIDDSIAVCKIGEERHTGDLDVPNFTDFDASYFADLNSGYVIGATPFSIQTNRLANVEFDVVLFDEASQITLPLAIMGMLAGGKYVFVGDENQLPPVTVLSDQQASQISIFNYLAGRGNETMLNITYRLNEELSAWPSRTFYGNELKPSEEAAGRRLQISDRASRWDFVLDPAASAVFLDLCHRNNTVRSRREADIAVEIILALLHHGLTASEIGVVTPYRAQSRLIRSLLRRNVTDHSICDQVVVDTVERMQGQEKEVIILSFTSSSPAFIKQMADFLFQPQRLNVAVTRPRTKLILIGSHHIFDAEFDDPEETKSIELFKSLVDDCLQFTIPDGLLE
jgi:DNA replication ATP-dependent helicase Dna2